MIGGEAGYKGDSPLTLIETVEDSRRGMLKDEEERHRLEILRINSHHDALLEIANGAPTITPPTLIGLLLDVCGPWSAHKCLQALASIVPGTRPRVAEAEARETGTQNPGNKG